MQDLLRALCVIALVFLNFGHVPLAAGAEAAAARHGVNFCGDPVDGPAEAKANPCQVCRIGSGADLPPPPCSIEPGRGLAPPVHDATDRRAIVLRANWRACAQRAPPALV
ncbi:MAG: hypothetical protein Q8L54_03315 [Devosia sp.]|nr:hypothetical protein [Devosia sp.]